MHLSEIKVSIKEVAAICAVVFSLGGGAFTLNSLSGQVSELTKTVKGLSTSITEMKMEQQRMNLFVNFLYSEAEKAGWKPSEMTKSYWNEQLHPEDLK